MIKIKRNISEKQITIIYDGDPIRSGSPLVQTNFHWHNWRLYNRKGRILESLSDRKTIYRICPCIIRTFLSQNEHVKLGVRIIHGVLCLVKQRKIWSEIWGCVLYMGAYYTRANTVIKIFTIWILELAKIF